MKPFKRKTNFHSQKDEIFNLKPFNFFSSGNQKQINRNFIKLFLEMESPPPPIKMKRKND